MKNKTAVIITLAILGIIVFLVLFLFINRSFSPAQPTEQPSPFGNTSQNREFSAATQPLIPTGERSGGSQTSPTPSQQQNNGILQKIHNGPILGFSLHTEEDGGFLEDIIRYTEANTGNMFEVNLTRPVSVTTLSGNTIIQGKQSVWGAHGAVNVIQYTDETNETIYSYLTTLGNGIENTTENGSTTATSTNTKAVTVAGRPLPATISSITISPNEMFLFYLQKETNGTVGYIETIETGTKNVVWRSALQHLQVYWPEQDTIYIATNPSLQGDSIVWSIDTPTEEVTPLITDQVGVQILPTNEMLAYSYYDTESGVMIAKVLNTTTGDVSQLPLGADVAKCAWGNTSYIYCAIPPNIHRETYLEDAQRGVVMPGDILWRFNVATGAAKQILTPEDESGFAMSIVDMEVNDSETFLLFREYSDDSIWRVLLPEDGWLFTEEETVEQAATSTPPQETE